jgi:hypothetical protein
LDKDKAIQKEVWNAAKTLCKALEAQREGRLVQAGQDLKPPRDK